MNAHEYMDVEHSCLLQMGLAITFRAMMCTEMESFWRSCVQII